MRRNRVSLFCTWKAQGWARNACACMVNNEKRHHKETKLQKWKVGRERQKVGTKHYTPVPENKDDESGYNYEVRPKWCNKLPLKLPESWANLTHLMKEIWKGILSVIHREHNNSAYKRSYTQGTLISLSTTSILICKKGIKDNYAWAPNSLLIYTMPSDKKNLHFRNKHKHGKNLSMNSWTCNFYLVFIFLVSKIKSWTC